MQSFFGNIRACSGSYIHHVLMVFDHSVTAGQDFALLKRQIEIWGNKHSFVTFQVTSASQHQQAFRHRKRSVHLEKSGRAMVETVKHTIKNNEIQIKQSEERARDVWIQSLANQHIGKKSVSVVVWQKQTLPWESEDKEESSCEEATKVVWAWKFGSAFGTSNLFLRSLSIRLAMARQWGPHQSLLSEINYSPPHHAVLSSMSAV